MSRLPVRAKVTLAFTGALALVLAAVGVFLYVRLGADLQRTADRGLDARAADLVALARRDARPRLPANGPGLPADESVAQVLTARGAVLAASARAMPPLLTPAELRRARRGVVWVDRPGDSRLDESLRVRAAPVRGGTRVAVVGSSADERAEALASLLKLELLGFGAALLAAALAGYLVAGIALRPVDAMRRGADAIADRPDRRLPVPAVDDELGRLGRTLNAMLERLDRASARERHFVADASHELRTPLAVLRGEIEVALLEDGTPAELRAALRSAGEEAERLTRLAEDLLTLAQEDGAGVRHAERIDAGDLLRTVAARHERRFAEAGRRLAVDAPGGLTVAGDRRGLEQALGNLADNALRHGAGETTLRAHAVPDGIALTVRDEGPGVSERFAGRAFERFTRGDDARDRPGAGLGLAIVDGVARAHGGAARIAGAEVTLVLPSSPNPHPARATMSA